MARLRGERDAPYVFVGREEELDRPTIVAHKTVRQGENLSGICLVDGIPGIGKTHFLNALEGRDFIVRDLDAELRRTCSQGLVEGYPAARHSRRSAERPRRISKKRIS